MIHLKAPSLLFAVATIIFNVLLWNSSKAYGTTHPRGTTNVPTGVIDDRTNGFRTETTSVIRDALDHQQQSVVICGGGPGGLLASVLLNNIGIHSTVVEQAIETDSWGIKSYTMILNDKGKESLARGGCLQAAIEAGQERSFTGFFNPTTGEMKRIPKKSPNLAVTRHGLVKCLEEIASGLPNVTLRKGAGVSGISNNDENPGLMSVDLDDGTSICATHVIGADGKWSNVRRSIPSLSAAMITCPSSAVHMDFTTIPEGWESNGTYLMKPTNEECKFYIIVSSIPEEDGMSISMIYYDETLQRYPWLTPPESINTIHDGDNNIMEGWDGDHSLDKGNTNDSSVSTEHSELPYHLKRLFEEELPAFADLLDDEIYHTAVLKRRTTWLQMRPRDGEQVSYSSKDGRVSLIGDAAHAMTPSIGEGCNTALESAVNLVDRVAASMKDKDESTCTVDTMSLAFTRYGSSRPKECITIQELSAAKSTFAKQK